MRCTCCNNLITIEACEIRGLANDNLMVNCPCKGTITIPAPGPISETFRMLHGLAEAVGQLKEEFDGARMALDCIADQAVEPLDKQFARDLAARIDRKEKLLKEYPKLKEAV